MDQIEFYADGKNFTGKAGGLRSLNEFMSNNTDLPMVIRYIHINIMFPDQFHFSSKTTEQNDRRVGHYYFDNKPLIGRMVDINVWSRSSMCIEI